MKMTPEHYTDLTRAIHRTLAERGYTVASGLAYYRQLGLSNERYRWDLLHASGFDTRRLYDAGLNDSHVDTALRRITETK